MKINRNFVYLGIALLLGVAASLMAVHYVDAQVAARAVGPTQETRSVVVPVRDLEAGATLPADAVAAREVPVDFIPADALTSANYDQYLDQVLRAPLAQGAPIPASAVELVKDHFSGVIAPGHVAYTLQVDEANSVSGMIVPGDRIDVLLLTSDGGNDALRPLLADVLVLATGRHAPGVRDSESADSYSNITLQLPPADAQRIGVARKIGDLQVMLRPAGSREAFDLKTFSKADLLRMGQRARGGGIQFIVGGGS